MKFKTIAANPCIVVLLAMSAQNCTAAIVSEFRSPAGPIEFDESGSDRTIDYTFDLFGDDRETFTGGNYRIDLLDNSTNQVIETSGNSPVSGGTSTRSGNFDVPAMDDGEFTIRASGTATFRRQGSTSTNTLTIFDSQRISVVNVDPRIGSTLRDIDLEANQSRFLLLTATDDSPLDTLEYVWDRGDGSPEFRTSDRRFELSYESPGRYEASVFVADDDDGMSLPSTFVVTVSAVPEPGFGFVLGLAAAALTCVRRRLTKAM